MPTLCLQLAPFPPLVRGSRMNCTKRFSTCTYLPLQPASFPGADRLSFLKDCSRSWLPPMSVTSAGTRIRPVNSGTRDRHLLPLTDAFDVFAGKDDNIIIKPTLVACLISTAIVLILGAFLAAVGRIQEKGIHNLVIVSGDEILLYIASIRSVRTEVAKFTVVLALLTLGLCLRDAVTLQYEAHKRNLKKQS